MFCVHLSITVLNVSLPDLGQVYLEMSLAANLEKRPGAAYATRQNAKIISVTNRQFVKKAVSHL